MKQEDRKAQILEAALTAAADQKLTFQEVANRAGVSQALVCHYFKTKPQLERDVMRAALRTRHLLVIAYGLVTNDRHARKAPDELKKAAMDALRNKVGT